MTPVSPDLSWIATRQGSAHCLPKCIHLSACPPFLHAFPRSLCTSTLTQVVNLLDGWKSDMIVRISLLR